MTEFVPSLQPGDVIAERYVVRRKIAQFGVNDLCEAHDRLLDRVIDVFSVRVEESRTELIEESLRRDLALSQRVLHPNVWQLYAYESDLHGGVLVAEHLGGHSLHKVIRDRHEDSGFSAEVFRSIATQLCAGLSAIHAAGIVHADLKPGRVQVDGGRVVLRMFEFAEDIALIGEGPGAHGGTPQYMSPERLRNLRPSTMDDVYALGKTLLEAWTCHVPTIGENPLEKPLRQLVTINPFRVLERAEIRQIFSMLQEDPAKRPKANELKWGERLCMEMTNEISTKRGASRGGWVNPDQPLPKTLLRTVVRSFAINFSQLKNHGRTDVRIRHEGLHPGRLPDDDHRR